MIRDISIQLAGRIDAHASDNCYCAAGKSYVCEAHTLAGDVTTHIGNLEIEVAQLVRLLQLAEEKSKESQ